MWNWTRSPMRRYNHKVKATEQSSLSRPTDPPAVLPSDLMRASNALDLMRNVTRAPLGTDPERDAAVVAAWRSGAATVPCHTRRVRRG
jgi:hypothetical protein